MTNTYARTYVSADPRTGAELLLVDLSSVTTPTEARVIVDTCLTPQHRRRNGAGVGFSPTYRFRGENVRCQPEPVYDKFAAAESVLRHASHWDLDVTSMA